MKIQSRAPSSSNILCLDVAFANLGYAVFSKTEREFIDYGVISVEKEETRYVAESNQRRCSSIALSLDRLIRQHSPALVIAELPHGGAISSRASVCMGMSVGVVSAMVAIHALTLVVVQPSAIKRLVAPKGAVTKEDVIQCLKTKFGIELPRSGRTEHIADAMMALFAVNDSLKLGV